MDTDGNISAVIGYLKGDEKYEDLPIGPDFKVKEYPVNHRRRGKAIIFNHFAFKDEKAEERHGSQQDVISLYKELSVLGFEVDLQYDRKYEEIQKKLKQSKYIAQKLC